MLTPYSRLGEAAKKAGLAESCYEKVANCGGRFISTLAPVSEAGPAEMVAASQPLQCVRDRVSDQ